MFPKFAKDAGNKTIYHLLRGSRTIDNYKSSIEQVVATIVAMLNAHPQMLLNSSYAVTVPSGPMGEKYPYQWSLGVDNGKVRVYCTFGTKRDLEIVFSTDKDLLTLENASHLALRHVIGIHDHLWLFVHGIEERFPQIFTDWLAPVIEAGKR